ncbi:MAG: penicillin-binding protein 2 [Alphaproteobacteria bacterium]
MDLESERHERLTRRALVLGGGQALLLTALVGRMYQLQILESDQYQMLAEENRIDLRLMAPLRGRIIDRFGEELATNRLSYRVSVIPEQAVDLDETMLQLARLMSLTPFQVSTVLREAKRSRSFLPVTVADNVSWEEFARVNTHIADLPGVYPDVGPRRFYPFPELSAPVVGYVGPVTEEELKDLPKDPTFMLPDFRIGKRGLEAEFEEQLRGTAGARRVEVNALGREIRELTRDKGRPGEDLNLSIDLDAQRFAMERLGEQSAGVVVMNIHTGEVIVLASSPGFDPNEFNFGISTENWRGLLADPRKPLHNKAIQGQFPPASTFKMLMAMAAVDEGLVSPDHRINCPGHMRFGNRRFHCWKRGGHGWLNMAQSIEQSCDVYFYDLALKLGVDKIAAMSRRFGLGESLGIELDHEASGLVPTEAWKRRRFNEPWHEGENLSIGIGQGYMLATPLQLAVMTARMANGGYAVKPSLLAPDPVALSAQPFDSIGVSQAALAIAQQGMIDVMEGSRGTARRSRIKDWPRGIAGKTGTAQVRRITAAERRTGVLKNDQLPWQERDHSLFVGYGPIDDPVYSVAVVVQHGGGGSKVAAPIASDILRRVLVRDPCQQVANRPEGLEEIADA